MATWQLAIFDAIGVHSEHALSQSRATLVASRTLKIKQAIMERPELNDALSAAEFGRWYWLKSELVAFCRQRGLSCQGGKQEIARRIEAALSGQATACLQGPRSRAPSAPMPERLEPSTVIGRHWRLSRSLRVYFEGVHGPGFHFNEALRQFLAQGCGRTLAEASEHYRQSLQQPKGSIARQFEYNRHTREFFATHPGATRQQAIASWWAKRGKPTAS